MQARAQRLGRRKRVVERRIARRHCNQWLCPIVLAPEIAIGLPGLRQQ
jgi:hypothetical protein